MPDVSQTRAQDAVERCLASIEANEPSLSATITVMAADARERAYRCDQAKARGEWSGILHGLPIAVKDNIDTQGTRTTCGSKFFAEYVPEADAPVVARLVAAGAIPVLKANMAEFAIGATTQNPHFGGCRNPWDPSRIPGGSSGGSGAAVAAGMAMAALGTDTSGSVRIPGAINGVAAMRPTMGRVSNRGTTPVSLSFDTVGPLARSVSDVARVLVAIQGYDPEDRSSIDGPADDILDELRRGLPGLRIGVPRNYFFEELTPEIAAATRAAVDVMSDLGADVQDIDISGAEHAHAMMHPLLHADLAAFHQFRLNDEPELFGEDVYRRLQLGNDISGVEYATATIWRAEWIDHVDRLFDHVDLIVSPSMAVQTPPAEGADMIEVTRRLTRFTAPWSMANLPSLSVPCGFDTLGLPLGIQLAGRRWTDGLVLRAGVAYQEATEWHLARPAADVLGSDHAG